ncbi:MAG TPA: YciI family protein [Chitinophaga sp.]|uniref:YciI family protein n=1 Tax=Chitinophaga sp. TaxID=1869181 RepID=UPI002B7E8018|nr:YciI family protein [Chitinophaga sp.]HVI45898.1 YciI family protein [Chitinophaga sp.]
MASEVVPALMLLGFLIVVVLSFHPTPLKNVVTTISAPGKKTDVSNVKRYWMVFLKKGPQCNQPEEEAARIRQAQYENIARLVKAGKMLVTGPFDNEEDLRGIYIMDCKDSLEAVELVNTDPAVRAGRLVFEVKPWLTEKNSVFK